MRIARCLHYPDVFGSENHLFDEALCLQRLCSLQLTSRFQFRGVNADKSDGHLPSEDRRETGEIEDAGITDVAAVKRGDAQGIGCAVGDSPSRLGERPVFFVVQYGLPTFRRRGIRRRRAYPVALEDFGSSGTFRRFAATTLFPEMRVFGTRESGKKN